MATPTHQVSYTRPHLIGIALFLSCLARCKTLCTCYCHRAHRRRDPWRLKLNSRVRLGGLIIQNQETSHQLWDWTSASRQVKISILQLGSLGFLVFWRVQTFSTCFPYFLLAASGMGHSGCLRMSQLVLYTLIRGATCQGSGISPVDSFTERELQKIRHEPDWNIWESMWQWLFHVVSHEFQWNVTFPETDAHDLAQGARWSKRSKRSLCSSNWRHPNILPTNFWTSIG